MKVAIVGSRDYPLPDLVRQTVILLANKDPKTVIISGGARGVDQIAAEQARRCGLEVVEFLADWDTYGKGGGFLA